MIDWLLSPVVGLSAALAVIYTLAVHLFMGLGLSRVLRHWLLAMVGMLAGQALAGRAGSHLPLLGDLHVVEASGAAVALLILTGLWRRWALNAPPPP